MESQEVYGDEVIEDEVAGEVEEKDPELVEFTNRMLVSLRFNEAIANLTTAKGWKSDDKFKMVAFLKGIMDSPEIKAYDDMIKDIKKEHDEEQEKLDEDERKALSNDDPQVAELLDVETGLSVKKLKIKVKVLPEAVSAADVMGASWLIDVIKVKGDKEQNS